MSNWKVQLNLVSFRETYECNSSFVFYFYHIFHLPCQNCGRRGLQLGYVSLSFWHAAIRVSCFLNFNSRLSLFSDTPKMSEEPFAEACPVCRMNCNCKACLRMEAPSNVCFSLSLSLLSAFYYWFFMHLMNLILVGLFSDLDEVRCCTWSRWKGSVL